MILMFRPYAATHLEPQGARRVFPCFDEPQYKAIFQLQVTSHKNFSVISNTEIKNKTLPGVDARVTTTFKPTPIMPTYNLAILVSDFLKITNNRTNHSILFPSTVNADTVDFVLQMAYRILKQYEIYTDIPFELTKMDLAIVPNYPAALENWGSIFFR